MTYSDNDYSQAVRALCRRDMVEDTKRRNRRAVLLGMVIGLVLLLGITLLVAHPWTF